MPKPTPKQSAVGAVVALILLLLLALIANAGRVCATVQNPMGRAICDTVVQTAQQKQKERDDEKAAAQLDAGTEL